MSLKLVRYLAKLADVWACRCVGKRYVPIQCSCERWAEGILIRRERNDGDELRLERERAETKAAQRISNALSEHAAGPSNPSKRSTAELDASFDSISNNAAKQKTKSRKIKEGINCSLATASSSSSRRSELFEEDRTSPCRCKGP